MSGKLQPIPYESRFASRVKVTQQNLYRFFYRYAYQQACNYIRWGGDTGCLSFLKKILSSLTESQSISLPLDVPEILRHLLKTVIFIYQY